MICASSKRNSSNHYASAEKCNYIRMFWSHVRGSFSENYRPEAMTPSNRVLGKRLGVNLLEKCLTHRRQIHIKLLTRSTIYFVESLFTQWGELWPLNCDFSVPEGDGNQLNEIKWVWEGEARTQLSWKGCSQTLEARKWSPKLIFQSPDSIDQLQWNTEYWNLLD